MKKLITFAIAIVALTGISALAGDYHTGTSLYCNECHIMHGQQSHAYDNVGGTTPAVEGGPHEYLLRKDVNGLCIDCHDGKTFAPDVVKADINTTLGGRLAGAVNIYGEVDATYGPDDGHTIGAPSVVPPGGTVPSSATHGLACIDCHHQHGKGTSTTNPQGSYRNLNFYGGAAGDTVTYAIGTNNTNRWVFERIDPVEIGTKASFDQHYGTANVDYNEPDQAKSAYAAFCKTCHTDFHGAVGDAATIGGVAGTTGFVEFVRHPAAGVNIGAAGGGHSGLSTYTAYAYDQRVKMMMADGNWTAPVTASNATPSCFSCHKSHGSSHSFGLIYPTDPKNGGVATALGEDGTGTTYYGLCRQCHRQ